MFGPITMHPINADEHLRICALTHNRADLAMNMPWDYSFATHLPLLIEHVLKTTGPVLEIGGGLYSTPCLHALCDGKRILVTVEKNPEWRDKIAKYRSDWHVITDEVPEEMDWSVVLIDGPADERRKWLDRLCGKAQFLILHDTEDPEYGYAEPLSCFPKERQREYAWLIPKTMVVSHFNNVRTRDA